MEPSSRITRMVDGRTSSIRDFPYQVALEKYSKQVCGGAIISRYFVLTAAHCLKKNYHPTTYRVRVGSSLRHRGGTLHRVQSYVIHEEFRESSDYINAENDLALLLLENPILFDITKLPIAMFDPGQESRPGSRAVVAGWGRLWHRGAIPRQLQSIELVVLSKDECGESYRNRGGFRENEICAAASEHSKHQSMCHGDSGSPLVIDGKLAGVVAHGGNDACSTLKYPNVFTEVAFFREWIERKISDLNEYFGMVEKGRVYYDA